MRLIFIALLAISTLGYSQENIIPKFREVSELVDQQKYSSAHKVLESIIKKNSEEWVNNEAYYFQSVILLKQGQKSLALESLRKAITHGFNNFYALHQEPSYREIFSDPKFQEIYKTMRISPADLQELLWLISEMSYISDQTSLMIIENMGRHDNNYTTIPQSTLPTRTPQSPTIITSRAYVKYMQEHQN